MLLIMKSSWKFSMLVFMVQRGFRFGDAACTGSEDNRNPVSAVA
jgi:hypothetical protein